MARYKICSIKFSIIIVKLKLTTVVSFVFDMLEIVFIKISFLVDRMTVEVERRCCPLVEGPGGCGDHSPVL